MLIPAGWHGRAYVDRSTDPMQYGAAVLTADFSSADGQERVQMLSAPFHTLGASQGVAAGMPGNPMNQLNVAMMRFTSTEDLLKQRILPALQIPGTVEHVQSAGNEQETQRALENDRARGFNGPIRESAFAVIRNGNQSTIVFGYTTGSDRGTERENTTTMLTLVSAPSDRIESLPMKFFSLQQPAPSAAWQRADAQYNQMRTAQINQQSQAQSAAIQAQTQQIVNQGHANVRAMQQQGAARDAEFQRRQQAITDRSQNFQGYLLNENKSFKWCNGASVVYTVNSTVSPGAGYQRCN